MKKKTNVRRWLAAALSVFTALLVSAPFVLPAYAAGEAFTGDEDVTGLITMGIPITDLQISGDDDEDLTLTLHAEHGTLEITTTTDLTFDSANPAQTLKVSGKRTDINAGLASLHYSAYKLGTFTIEATLGGGDGEVYNPANGHVYQVVAAGGGGITWDDAKVAAEGMTYNGAEGYLATITTSAESAFIVQRLADDGWMGASDIDSEGDWKWVAGPEVGTSFWDGGVDGQPVNGMFTNWGVNQPDNYNGEHCGQIVIDQGGVWNDLPCGNTLPYYVVEFGTSGEGNPAVVSKQITVNVVGPEVEVDTCEELKSLETEGGNYYTTVTLTDDIDCGGQTIEPLFAQNDFMGTLDGNGKTIRNVVIDDPTGECRGLIARTKGASIVDLTLENITVTAEARAGTLVGCAQNTALTNVHTANAEVNITWGNSGGLVGLYEAIDGAVVAVHDISASGTVTSEYGSALGGLIGSVRSEGGSQLSIQKVYAETEVTMESVENDNIGGLFGFLELDLDGPEDADTAALSLHDAYVWGDVHAGNNWSVGGIIGRASVDDDGMGQEGVTLDIQRVYFNGTVVGYENVGGLIGYFSNLEESFDNAYVLTDSFVTGGTVTSNLNGGPIGSLVGRSPNSEGVVQYERNYFDLDATGVEACVGNQVVSGCSAVNSDGSQPNYFINNTNNHPFSDGEGQRWDFDTIWVSHADTPPTFGQASQADDEDLNGDTIPDSEQPHVSGFISPVTGKTVAIDAGEGCELTTDTVVTESSLSAQDPAYDYANGLFDFAANCGEDGFTTTISLYYYNVEKGSTLFRKFNPNTQQYATINNASISETTIHGSPVTVVTYQLADGGELDMDGEVNGSFKDPAGLGERVGALAGTGLAQWLYALVAALLVLAASIVFTSSYFHTSRRAS